MSGGSGQDDAARIDRESNLAQIGNITHASVDDRACEFARRHGRAHQPTHPCNVRPILYRHHIHRVFGSLVDRGKHRGECIGIMILFLHHLYGYRVPANFVVKMGCMWWVIYMSLSGELLNRVGDRDFNVPVSGNHSHGIVCVHRGIGKCLCVHQQCNEQGRER